MHAPVLNTQQMRSLGDNPVEDAKKLREVFGKFVGTSVFGQMLSSMRKTVGEPAYFHGGQAEKVFQGQLDQQLASSMAEGGASSMAEGMFRQQFPKQAELLRNAEAGASSLTELDRLAGLPRR